MPKTKAVIITIGDELLIGQTIDTNSAWIAKQLNPLGIDVVRRVAVGDTEDAIRYALDEELPKADIILLTGGLGPTADDITKPLLCEYFGGKMIVDERVRTHVTDMFQRRNRPFLERNLKQAEVPDVCTVLFNRIGTAPGMLFHKDGKIVISMPGVPFEMVAIMEDEVLPLLKAKYISDAIVHKTIVTIGEGESFIAEKIEDIETALPKHIKLAYLPSPGLVKLRLTGHGDDKAVLEPEVARYQDKIAERLGNIVVAKEDLTIEEILGLSLKQKGKTLALAESCTGGYISHLITQIPGASEYFKGGVVSYLNEIKTSVLHVDAAIIEAHGVVSEQVASAMAQQVRNLLKSDYGFGVTGILGPGMEDGKVSLGTVWIAVSDGNETTTKQLKLFYDRIRNKESAATLGMMLMWKFINHIS